VDPAGPDASQRVSFSFCSLDILIRLVKIRLF
jgi:hypothetical protein